MRRLPIALLLALALPACGSTVATTGTGAQGVAGAPGSTDSLEAPVPGTAGSDGLGVAEPGTTSGAAASGAAGSGTTGGGAGTSNGSAGGSAGPGAASGSGPAAGPAAAAGAVGPGITADAIHLGIAYFPDAAAGNAALGAAGANAGDQRDYYDAVIDDVNSRGGVLGRKLVPIYHEYRTGEPIDPQHEAACQRWTKDNKVFAILFRGRILQECAMRAGALIISGDGEAGPTYQRVPNLVDPGAVRLERLGQATVSGLHREKYFEKTPDWPTGKIGVITWQDPSYEYGVKQGYLPALAKLGLRSDLERYVVVSQQVGSAADSSSAVSSAVLAFRTAGIDHVLIQDGAAGVFGLGGLTLLFLNNAKSQNYFPRYGFNANNVPGFSIYPSDQQRGMLAVDFSDYMPTQDEGIAPNPARERCHRVLEKGGVTPSDQTTYATAAGACDGVWFVETLLRKASQPTLQGALQAAASLGTSYRSPQVYGTLLDGSRRDGGHLARNARYDTGCSCMRYTGQPYVP
ncbi:MAG: hypothetical protein EPN99_05600 [Frankiales bacterium]|nr:MAG: hypothetical protein EPN99_05600 [Frankiales bacterium]